MAERAGTGSASPGHRFPLERGPMRTELSEEQKLLQETVRRFAEEVVRPRAKEIDETGEFPRGFYDQAGELGLAGVSVPEGRRRHGHRLVLPGDRGDQPGVRDERGDPVGEQLAGLRPDPQVRQRRAEAGVPDPARLGGEARLLRADRARGRVGRGGPADDRPARRRRLRARRREGVHHQRHARRRGAGLRQRLRRGTAGSPPSSCRPTARATATGATSSSSA